MSRNNAKQKPQQNQQNQMPSNARELAPNTADRLTAGKIYAIKKSGQFLDDPEVILTEDMIVSDIPDGFTVIKALSERHYIPVNYNVNLELASEELTGLAPSFYGEPEELESDPTRRSVARGGIFKDRAKLLEKENRVMREHTSLPNAVGTSLVNPNPPSGTVDDEDVPETLE